MNQQNLIGSKKPDFRTGEPVGMGAFNTDCILTNIDKIGADIYRREVSEMIGSNIESFLANPTYEHGKDVQRVIDGGEINNPVETDILRGDKTVTTIRSHLRRTEDPNIISYRFIEITDGPTKYKAGRMSTNRKRELSKNIRIDTAKGKLTLNEVVQDLTVGYNEIEQYKDGALCLSQALEERLEEEEMIDKHSETCQLIKEVQEMAINLHSKATNKC